MQTTIYESWVNWIIINYHINVIITSDKTAHDHFTQLRTESVIYYCSSRAYYSHVDLESKGNNPLMKISPWNELTRFVLHCNRPKC